MHDRKVNNLKPEGTTNQHQPWGMEEEDGNIGGAIRTKRSPNLERSTVDIINQTILASGGLKGKPTGKVATCVMHHITTQHTIHISIAKEAGGTQLQTITAKV